MDCRVFNDVVPTAAVIDKYERCLCWVNLKGLGREVSWSISSY